MPKHPADSITFYLACATSVNRARNDYLRDHAGEEPVMRAVLTFDALMMIRSTTPTIYVTWDDKGHAVCHGDYLCGCPLKCVMSLKGIAFAVRACAA